MCDVHFEFRGGPSHPGAALAFAGIDFWYVLNGTISPI